MKNGSESCDAKLKESEMANERITEDMVDDLLRKHEKEKDAKHMVDCHFFLREIKSCFSEEKQPLKLAFISDAMLSCV